jgi:hypothetical protein
MPEVSLLATLVGTLLGFALGGVWYGPLFSRAWMAENGFTVENIKQNFNPLKLYGTTFVLGLISSYVFGMFVGPHPDMRIAISSGVAVGVTWVATSFGTSYLFEGKSMRHFLINAGYHAVQFVLIGVAFGWLG